MKIALIQPDLDSRHQNQRQAYGSASRPPETGLAVLGSWIKKYASRPHEITVLDPGRNLPDLAKQAGEADFLGISDWFSNHDNCVSLAREAKSVNPDLTVVLGGPNASMIPKEILNNHPYVDYVVSRDGEDAFLSLVDGKAKEKVPNLWFRDGSGKPRFTRQGYTDLTKMPVWDFSDFQNLEKRMEEYLSVQKSGRDVWLVPPLTIFSSRGCLKAACEGVCEYCTSAEQRVRLLPPEILWRQITHMNRTYDAEVFYMCDDIFPISPARVKSIAEAKPAGARARIRAYGYLPDLAKLSGARLTEVAKHLEKIGVFNLFFGSEHFDQRVLSRMKKAGVGVEETSRIVKTLHRAGGIKTTIACLLGLPGESGESLEKNLNAIRFLIGSDIGIERLYISLGMPLKGTPWYRMLESNPKISREYKQMTGKNLASDDSPDYMLLSDLSVRHLTSTSRDEINEYVALMIDFAKKKMPSYRIGGFMLPG